MPHAPTHPPPPLQWGAPVYPPSFVSFQAGPSPWSLAPPAVKFPVAATGGEPEGERVPRGKVFLGPAGTIFQQRRAPPVLRHLPALGPPLPPSPPQIHTLPQTHHVSQPQPPNKSAPLDTHPPTCRRGAHLPAVGRPTPGPLPTHTLPLPPPLPPPHAGSVQTFPLPADLPLGSYQHTHYRFPHRALTPPHADAVQTFPLPADLPLGRYLRVNLHGKRQRQLEDMQVRLSAQ